jgi:hypothetical protein
MPTIAIDEYNEIRTFQDSAMSNTSSPLNDEKVSSVASSSLSATSSILFRTEPTDIGVWSTPQKRAKRILANLPCETSPLRAFLSSYSEEETMEFDANLLFIRFKDIQKEEKLEAFQIIDKLFSCLQTANLESQEGKIKELKEYCKHAPSRINNLFYLLDYFGLEKLQEEYFEPFNEKFPEVPINEAPESILSIVLPEMLGTELKNLKLERLEKLTHLDLSSILNLTHDHFTVIYQGMLEEIKLPYNQNVSEFNFSGLKNIKKLNLSNYKGLTAEQFNSISKDKIESIDLAFNMNTIGFNFSGLNNLKKLIVKSHKKLTAEEFNSIPKDKLEKIRFVYDQDVTGFDFSNLNNIKTLDLPFCKKLTSEQFNAVPKDNLESLRLPYGQDITGFDLSEFQLRDGEIRWIRK